MDLRRRIAQRDVTVRAKEDGSSTVTGYAAVFYREGEPGTEYRIGKHFVERIDRDAFSSALDREDDVRALFNHDSNQVLGRTKAGTLRQSVDPTGLRYDIDMPTTQTGQDVAESIRRGDVTGSSFAFEILEETRSEKPEEDLVIYNIRDVRLYDVGPVTFPAYEATSTELRSARFQWTPQEDHRPKDADVVARFRELQLRCG